MKIVVSVLLVVLYANNCSTAVVGIGGAFSIGVSVPSISSPIAQTTVCTAANEQFYSCGWCTRTCANPSVICPLICRLNGGCGCISGFVRDTANGGACVNETSTACVAQRETTVPTTTVTISEQCAANEQFYSCGACDGTCAEPDVICAMICREPGNCGCISGFVRDTANGKACVQQTSAACVAQRAA